MSEPIAQVDVEAQLLEINGSLDQITHAVAKRARERARTRVAYKVAFARARLAASGTVAEREDQATLATEEAYTAFEMAEAVLDAAKQAGLNEREKAQNTRSINANHRALVTG